MYVITYVRSSTGQDHLEAQQKRLIEALSTEYEIVGNYSDATPELGFQQPGLAAALDRLATGGIEGLYVTSVDRLARSSNQLDAIHRWCDERGLVVKEVSEMPESS